MLNILCICLHSVLYSSSFFFAKLPGAYDFLNPIVDVIPIIPFSISFCMASCYKFSMIFLILSYKN